MGSEGITKLNVAYVVSIQLVSPASGEQIIAVESVVEPEVSIQLVSPASGETEDAISVMDNPRVSIQLVSPASGEPSRQPAVRLNRTAIKFPFN